MAYTKTNWVNDSAPAINATNLNKIEQGIADNADALDNIGTIVNSYRTTAGSAATGTWTTVCTVTLTPGVWLLIATAKFATSSSSGGRYVSLEPSADAHATSVSAPGSTITPHTLKCTRVYTQSSPTQTYYFAIMQSSGSTMTIDTGTSGGSNSLRAVRIK